MLTSANPPVVLAFSTLDPSGSGGIQADIETAASLGCHCSPIVTSLCASGSLPNADILAVDSTILIEQARSILHSMDVQAIKIGFLGSRANAEAVHSILLDFNDIPVVSQPALSLIDDNNKEHADLVDAYTNLILPYTSIANFSLFEAREIAKETDTVDTTAHAIISLGCDKALITGTGKQTQAFQNSAYSAKGLIKSYPWEQEALVCHGSSSTLTMSIAAYLAHGFSDIEAIEQAQNFTWQTVRASRELGFENRTPHRFYWADKNIEASTDSVPAGKKTH